jgi:hypothetical protein
LLGDKTNELARWLDDCATVTAWCREHDTTEAADHD